MAFVGTAIFGFAMVLSPVKADAGGTCTFDTVKCCQGSGAVTCGMGQCDGCNAQIQAQ